MTQDEINDISVRIVGDMVNAGIIKDCTDTDDETEFAAQDIIREELQRRLGLNDNNILKCGDTVMWRGSFGSDAPKEAIVKGIDVDCVNKSGRSVPSIDWDDVDSREVIIGLQGGAWAYGTQISKK